MAKTQIRPAPRSTFSGWCISLRYRAVVVATSQEEAVTLDRMARERGDGPTAVIGLRTVTRSFIEGRVCYGHVPPELAVFARCVIGRDGQEYVVKKKE